MLHVSVPVMMHQHVDDLLKQVRLFWAKVSSRNLVNCLFELRQAVVVLLSIISKQQKKENSERNLSYRFLKKTQRRKPQSVVEKSTVWEWRQEGNRRNQDSNLCKTPEQFNCILFAALT